MRGLIYLLLFLTVFGLSFYFFTMNSDQQVQVRLFGNVTTPPLPSGLVILIAFYTGLLVGFLLFPLTSLVRRLS